MRTALCALTRKSLYCWLTVSWERETVNKQYLRPDYTNNNNNLDEQQTNVCMINAEMCSTKLNIFSHSSLVPHVSSLPQEQLSSCASTNKLSEIQIIHQDIMSRRCECSKVRRNTILMFFYLHYSCPSNDCLEIFRCLLKLQSQISKWGSSALSIRGTQKR